MTPELEIRELIEFARLRGAVVEVKCDLPLWIAEGRTQIDTISVAGLPGVCQQPMRAARAAEVLRKYAASILPPGEQATGETVKDGKASNVRKNCAGQ